MTRFVAFLRAINVGGRSVSKDKLSEAFCSMGFREVSTYKQSGNVIFEADSPTSEAVQRMLHEKLPGYLNFDTVAFVRTIPQLKRLLD